MFQIPSMFGRIKRNLNKWKVTKAENIWAGKGIKNSIKHIKRHQKAKLKLLISNVIAMFH